MLVKRNTIHFDEIPEKTINHDEIYKIANKNLQNGK